MNIVMDKVIGELYVGSWNLLDFVGLGYFIEYREFIDETKLIRKEIEDAQSYYLATTNNRAELLAVIYGLQSVIDNITSQKIKLDQINFYTVSKYLHNAVSQGWIYKWKSNNWMRSEWNGLPPRPIKNSDLWKQIIACEEKLRQLGIDLLLHFVPSGLTRASYRMGYFDKVNRLAHEAADEACIMAEKYFDELFSKEDALVVDRTINAFAAQSAVYAELSYIQGIKDTVWLLKKLKII